MSTSSKYAIPANASVLGIVSHGLQVNATGYSGSEALQLLRDAADRREFNSIDAQAASGDYFITLATKLDLMAQAMPRDSAEQIELENLVTALFYLQTHYKIVAKHKLV